MIAQEGNPSRENQDNFALHRQQCYAKARDSGFFAIKLFRSGCHNVTVIQWLFAMMIPRDRILRRPLNEWEQNRSFSRIKALINLYDRDLRNYFNNAEGQQKT